MINNLYQLVKSQTEMFGINKEENSLFSNN